MIECQLMIDIPRGFAVLSVDIWFQFAILCTLFSKVPPKKSKSNNGGVVPPPLFVWLFDQLKISI